MTTDGEFVMAGHLGGYVAGGDPATQYPDLWAWLVRWRGVRSVLDVGCGDGQALRYFRDLGCDVLGVEGVPQDDPDIVEHDFTLGPYVPPREFDLCWSCEFVEHVEQAYEANFLATFSCAALVLMTHADPGQPGHHHVNCQTGEYWVEKMQGIGYELYPLLTTATRRMAAANDSPWNHYARSGMAFERLSKP